MALIITYFDRGIISVLPCSLFRLSRKLNSRCIWETCLADRSFKALLLASLSKFSSNFQVKLRQYTLPTLWRLVGMHSSRDLMSKTMGNQGSLFHFHVTLLDIIVRLHCLILLCHISGLSDVSATADAALSPCYMTRAYAS